ncbi:HAD-IIIC family phosphatase [Lachnospiraceae bacterium 50-23]
MDVEAIRKQIAGLPVRDYMGIIKLARRLKKEQDLSGRDKVKVAVIGSCSLQYFVMVLRLFLCKYCVGAEILEGEYDGIHMAVFDKQSELYKFQPEAVIVLSDYRDIRAFPPVLSAPEEVDAFVRETMGYFETLWRRLSDIKGCHIFQSNIVIPLERALGNFETNVYYSRRNIYQMLNLELLKNRSDNVTIVDLEYIASMVGKERWFDNTSYFTSKLGYALDYIGVVCDIFAQQIAVLKGRVRKCLVLDLDNTLWGGVAADEGARGIQVDPGDAVGEAYLAFQKYILDLKSRGVILAVISKNDLESAKGPFEVNQNMLLKYEDFSVFIANWESKAENMELVSRKLNIGIDSLVFFDDNPAEREIIKMYHPEVQVIDVPENVADYVLALEQAHPFEWLNLTEEDLNRSDTYKSNRQREELSMRYEDYQNYLNALEMRGKVQSLEKGGIKRFTQLINKSNQFNLRTQRYSEAQIAEMLSDEEYILLSAVLEDRFSKFGMISCVILKKEGTACFIDTWVMSCRVLKRDVEKLVFHKIIESAQHWGCTEITGEYIETRKNALVKKLFSDLNFEEVRGDGCSGRKWYICKVSDAKIMEDIAIEEM